MKKRDLTEQEREEWLIENGQKPKASAPKKQVLAAAPVKKSAATRPIELGHTAAIDAKRLKATIEATLDLHGMSEDAAHRALTRFMKAAIASEIRTLLIITGKGKGVLRAAVPKWLDVPSLRPFILALTYATPKEGGEGAYRVLMKRKR
ncbi:MAG: Smr/MutS family protein [Alphaproteobacteria bacterium]|nr:Smr/MutS family protein [Alphaproteobacteria bacterium]